MRINFYRSVTEALGHGIRRFDTNARLAWFPILLITLFSMVAPYLLLSMINGQVIGINDVSPAQASQALAQNIGRLWQDYRPAMLFMTGLNYVIVTLMIASFFVPMLRYAGRGVEPSHRSVNLHIGRRELKFLLAALSTVASIGIVLYAPLVLSTVFIDGYVTAAMNERYASFPDPDSLHTIEIVSGMDDPTGYVLIARLLGLIFFVAIVYFSLRLFMVPVMAVLREKDDSYRSIRASWELTRGWNILKLLLVLGVLFLLYVLISLLLNIYAMPLVLQALNSMYFLIQGSSDLMADLGSDTSWILDLLVWIWTVIGIVVNIAFTTLLYGIIAGLGGSLFRQYQANWPKAE